MAEMQASFLSQQSEPLMRRSPRRKSLSPGPGTPLTPPPMDMQQLACSRGALGPALRGPGASPASPATASYKSNKSSWLSLPGISLSRGLGSKAPSGVLFGTGIVLMLSGVITSVLCFYMLSYVSSPPRPGSSSSSMNFTLAPAFQSPRITPW